MSHETTGTADGESAPQVLFLVGDQVAGSLPRQDMIAVSAFVSRLRAGHYDIPLPVLVPGQGIGAFELHYLRAELRRQGLDPTALREPSFVEPVGRAETHKQRQENVLVADLTQMGVHHYRAELCINDGNEIIQDHTTGQHVAGMVIMEAARQMFLAVTERYYLPAETQGYRFVIHSWETSFEKFLLPLDARLEYHVEKASLADSSRLRFRTRIDIIQGDFVAAVQHIAFTAYEAVQLSRREAQQATDVINHLAAQIAEGQQTAAPTSTV